MACWDNVGPRMQGGTERRLARRRQPLPKWLFIEEHKTALGVILAKHTAEKAGAGGGGQLEQEGTLGSLQASRALHSVAGLTAGGSAPSLMLLG